MIINLCVTQKSRKFMKNFFTIKKAAEMCGTTAETLRHYDRLGLVRPKKVDEWTGYRYYSEDEIVRINTVRALQSMGFSLGEIKDILQTDDFGRINALFDRALEMADRRIEELNGAKQKILRAKRQYAEEQTEQTHGGIYERTLPQRAIMLSDRLTAPSLENLTAYHRHFFEQVKASKKQYEFADSAGVYVKGGSRMFAICTKYPDERGLIMLPAGRYLCAYCAEEGRAEAEKALFAEAARRGAQPDFAVHMVVITGILQWKYEVQVFVGGN